MNPIAADSACGKLLPRAERWASLLPCLVLAACTGTAAVSNPNVHVSVDATAVGTPLQRVWPFYGYDEINYTTVPEGEALLAEVAAANSAKVRVRSHFLFNTGDGAPAMKWGSTNVYTEDAAGAPIYDWTLTDAIMDTIRAVGAFPFVELGFMPEALSQHPIPYKNSHPLLLNGGCFYPPSDYAKWAELVRTWATHANDRYPNVAGDWLWELWNEPDSGYWHGTFAEYTKLYDYTESALHQAIPKAALGGPAVIDAGGPFLREFLEHCASGSNAVTGATGTRLDLVTFHAKGGAAINQGHVELDLGNQLRLHRSGFDTVAAFSKFKRTPIYITEADPDGCAACPADIIPGAGYRTSTAYGAYEVAMMKRTLELGEATGVQLGGVLTWAFTFPGTAYFAGYRALATNGIDLPVLSAFKLLGRLSGARLPLVSEGAHPLNEILANGVRGAPDIDGIATQHGSATQILVWNYHDQLVPADATPVHLTIDVPPSFGPLAKVSHLRVDEAHGDAYSAWVSQGMPSDPSAEQIASLQAAMEPSLLLPDSIVTVNAEHFIAIDFALPRFGISLVTVQPAGSASETGADAGGSAGSE